MWAKSSGSTVAGVGPLSDRFVEMGGIPVNDDGGEQVEPGRAVVLAFARRVEPGRVLQMLVSAGSASPLSVHSATSGAVRKGIAQRTAQPVPRPPPDPSQERLI